VFKTAPVSFAVAGICLLLSCAGEPAASGLAWERGAILHGELWRLWSGHLVHFSPSHAGADVLALLALGALAEPLVGSRRYALVLGGGALLLSLGLLVFAPGMHEYRGASGLGVLTAVLGGVPAWDRHPGSRPVLVCAALALACKTLWEACAGMAAFTDLPAGGVDVAWQAHLLGAVLGGCAATLYQQNTNQEVTS
jgi:rhomboid family GlyGly-CTERM serine protease